MFDTCRRSAASRPTRRLGAPAAGLTLLLGAVAGCAGPIASRTPALVSEADYARVPDHQGQRVAAARLELAAARDALGRAKLNFINDENEGDLARADQVAAKADLSRAATETKAGKASNEPVLKQQALDDTAAAQVDKREADTRLAYSKKLDVSRTAQVAAAEHRVTLMVERVNLAKLLAMEEAGVPAAAKYDRKAALERVAEAQRAADAAQAKAAQAAGETAAANDQRPSPAP
jgi:hypothetical protein